MLEIAQLNTSHHKTLLYLVVILSVSYFTYFKNYSNPPYFFWDENYHIASAQKYLNNVFFMEQHPPLGKLLIALGEKITHSNATNDQFITTDYGKDLPEGFSFAGYRLIPTILAWLSAALLFGIFLLTTKKQLLSGVLSMLYVFDNASIVHTRSAMLEGTLLFFMNCTILFFLLTLKHKDNKVFTFLFPILFGISFGCVMTTKLSGLILILLYPALLFALWSNKKLYVKFVVYSAAAFIVTIVTVWQIHFALGSRIVESLPDKGYYQASDEYKKIIASGKHESLESFPVMLRDSINYVGHYNKGVPKLDLCKPDENGSPFFFWPFGGRSINYRWETAEGKNYRYLYLQANPVIWLCGLVGVLVCTCILVSDFLSPKTNENKRSYFHLITFFSLYVSYMIAMSLLDRVMYLYHYFPTLCFSFIIFGLILTRIHNLGKWQISEVPKRLGLLALSCSIVLSYWFYSPLTYYKALSDEEFQKRSILRLWNLRCVNCKFNEFLVRPRD